MFLADNLGFVTAKTVRLLADAGHKEQRCFGDLGIMVEDSETGRAWIIASMHVRVRA